MPRALALLCFLAILLLPGCGPKDPPFTDNSQDPEPYAKDIKQLVFTIAKSAKVAKEPVDNLSNFVNELEGQEKNQKPVGPYKAIYAELLSKVKPLMEECKSAPNGKPANLAARLDELKVIAEKLPGEVNKDPRIN